MTFTIAETGEEIEVFTTRPDTLWGVTFFVFAVEHPAVERLAELGGTADQVEPLRETGPRPPRWWIARPPTPRRACSWASTP